MMDKVKRYEELNKIYVIMESRLAKTQEAVKVIGKRKAVEVVEANLMIRRNEIKVLRMKLDNRTRKSEALEREVNSIRKA
jgi:hypothetical protein